MKVFQQDNYTTICGIPDEWEQMKAKFQDSDKVTVLDLRTATEAGGDTLEDLPEAWQYRAMPIQGGTISEQDVDVFRREQRRHGRMIALAANEARPCLLALADINRISRTPIPESELTALADLKTEQALLDWLKSYLERHQTTDQLGEY